MKLLLLAAALASNAGAFRDHARRTSLRKGLIATHGNSTGRYGNPNCPCVGLDLAQGETILSDGKVTMSFPADVGSHCQAWDNGRAAECQEGSEPGVDKGYCAQPWCFVDPCHCHDIDAPPKVTHFMQGVLHQGIPVYYSYSTCGGEDLWSKGHNPHACQNRDTQEACEKGDDCAWEESAWGAKCLGWEVAGLCGGVPEPETWGLETCPCVHRNGYNGTMEVDVGDGKIVDYPIDLGSVCKAWDMDVKPQCTGDDKAPGCDQRWCFVDQQRCKNARNEESTYLPGATYQGRRLHYSFETCGSKHPEDTPQEPHAEEKEPESEAKTEAEPEAKPEAKTEAEPEAKPEAGEDASEEGADAPPLPEGMGVKYDHDDYAEEWHNEWKHGHAESFKDRHPEVKDIVDRQSDGKPSPVA